MKRVSVTELKNGLSQYLRMVKRGATIEIVERSIPIARISGIGHDTTGPDERLERLIYEGVITRPRRKHRPLTTPPIPCDADVVAALIAERGDR